MPLRPHALLLGAALLVAAPTRAGDTTYSETRSVPRVPHSSPPAHSPAPPLPGPYVDEDRGEDLLSPEEKERQTFLQDCLIPDRIRNASELGFVVLTFPFRLGLCYVFDNFRASHAFLLTGEEEMTALRDRPWRFGWGFGFGALYMPGAAGGMPFSLHAEALRVHTPSVQLRLRLGTFGSLVGAPYDYERTVLVDGRPIGVQRDSLQSYSYSGYPLLAEVLWTGSAGLYLALGGGGVLMRETLSYTRLADFGPAPEPRREVRPGVRPVFSAAVGRLDLRRRGRSVHRFEIRYQATLMLPERRSSFPGDNSSSAHSLTWDWGWLW